MGAGGGDVELAQFLTGVLLGRELVSLGSLHDPRAEFRAASVPPKQGGEPVKQTAQGSAAAAESGTGTVDADDRTPAAKAS